MKSIFRFVLFFLSLSALAAAEPQNAVNPWEHSVVTIDVRRKHYDYMQPWTTPMGNSQKFGLVLEGRQILTTAEGLSDRTLLRVQKEGRGKWFIGEVKWVDYHANVALVSLQDESFWANLVPAELADPISPGANMQLIRWRSGKLEVRRAEFNQFTVEEGKLSYAQYIHLEVSCEINGAGWSEPLVAGGKVLGLTSYQNGNSCKVLPAPFIRSVLAEQKSGKYRGLGYFDFTWQNSENPATLKYLKLPGEQRGAVVIEIVTNGPTAGQLRPRDVILEVDGFEIDSTGDYNDPQYGHLMLESLATRKHWAGDKVKIKVWRDGKMVDVTYEIPKVDYNARLVPDHVFDLPPEYLVAGGLVFQPLTDEFLRSWGADWKRRAPFRLNYYNNDQPSPERSSLVVLSQVLPDPFNVGYQEYRFLVVDRVNGRKISRLSDLKEALAARSGDFQTIQFMRGDSLQKMVLDAGDLEKATLRVLNRYGIEKDHAFTAQSAQR